MKKIKLTQGYFAKVDDSDFELLNEYKWSLLKSHTNHFYARRSSLVNGKVILMHRLLLNYPTCSDHINGDGLDNQRHNLRECTFRENQGNRRKLGEFTSVYKGVYWEKCRKKWRAKITKGMSPFHIGYFDNEMDAAKAYDKVALEYFGEFANINFK